MTTASLKKKALAVRVQEIVGNRYRLLGYILKARFAGNGMDFIEK